MNKGQKVALKHAANAIDGTRPGPAHIKLGAGVQPSGMYTADDAGRPFATVILARRAGYMPSSQASAQTLAAHHFGLSTAQAAKVDKVAASTHNIKQRAERVARFLRRVAEEPTYVGTTRQPTLAAAWRAAVDARQ